MTAEPRDVEEIEREHYAVTWQRCDSDGVPNPENPLPPFCGACTDEEFVGAIEYGDTIDENADVVWWPCLPLELARRLAAADRENAELRERLRRDAEQRREVERLRALPYLNGVRVQDFMANRWASERDELRAQLAAAQAQLADLKRSTDGDRYGALSASAARNVATRAELDAAKFDYDELTEIYLAMRARAVAAEARLEAVRAVLRNADGDGRPGMVILAAQVAAALSAAPQLRRLGRADLVTEPPASDEPARTPDLMADLRASVDEAKERRTSSDELARCEHGFTAWHWVEATAQCAEWRCSGPAASGTPDGGSS